MKTRTLTLYALSLVCLVIAVIFFIRSLDWKSLVIIIFGVASVLLFRQAIAGSGKKG
jgi:hypothetical protein